MPQEQGFTEEAMSNVVPFRVTPTIEKKRILRAAEEEAKALYHITSGFVNWNQAPEHRDAWEEGLWES